MPPGHFDWEAVDAELQGISDGFKDPKFDPVSYVLNLLSSGDAEHELARLRAHAAAVDVLVESVADAYFAGFNRAIRNYSGILQRFGDAQEHLEAARISLGSAAPRLDARPGQVGSLRQRHALAVETLRLMDAVEEVLQVPAKAAALREHESWDEAATLLVESADVLARPEMAGIPALRSVREQLASSRTSLVDALQIETERRVVAAAVRAAVRESQKAMIDDFSRSDLTMLLPDGRRRIAHRSTRSVSSVSPLKPMMSTALTRTTSMAQNGLASSSLATPVKMNNGGAMSHLTLGPETAANTPFTSVQRRRHSRSSPVPLPRGLEDKGHLSDPATEVAMSEVGRCFVKLGANREAARRLRAGLQPLMTTAICQSIGGLRDGGLNTETNNSASETTAYGPSTLARSIMAAALAAVACVLATVRLLDTTRAVDSPGTTLLVESIEGPRSYPNSPPVQAGALANSSPDSPEEPSASALALQVWAEAQITIWPAFATILNASKQRPGRLTPERRQYQSSFHSSLPSPGAQPATTRRALSFPGNPKQPLLPDTTLRFQLRYELEEDGVFGRPTSLAASSDLSSGALGRSGSMATGDHEEEIVVAVRRALANREQGDAQLGTVSSAQAIQESTTAADRAALAVQLYPGITAFLNEGERLVSEKSTSGGSMALGAGPLVAAERSPSLLGGALSLAARWSRVAAGSSRTGLAATCTGAMYGNLDAYLRHDFLPEAYTALQECLATIVKKEEKTSSSSVTLEERLEQLEQAHELVLRGLSWTAIMIPCAPDLMGLVENTLGTLLDEVGVKGLREACAPLTSIANAALSSTWAERMAVEPAARLLRSADAFATMAATESTNQFVPLPLPGRNGPISMLGNGGMDAEHEVVRCLLELVGDNEVSSSSSSMVMPSLASQLPNPGTEAAWRELCTLCGALDRLVDSVGDASVSLPAMNDDDTGLAYILDRYRMLVCQGLRVLRLQLQLWLLAMLLHAPQGAHQSFEDPHVLTLLQTLESHAGDCLSDHEVQYILEGVRTVDEFVAGWHP